MKNSPSFYQAEKLSFFEKIFCRYKTIPVESGEERRFIFSYRGIRIPNSEFIRGYIIYHKIDRLTGGYEIVKAYD